MAVTNVKIIHNGWTGSKTLGGGVTFNVVYLVEVDDKKDGPQVVIRGAGVPKVNEFYQVGNDVDPFAFVKSVSPTPVSDMMWSVAVTFGPMEPSEEGETNGSKSSGLDEDGNPTDDPIEMAARISVSSVLVKRPAVYGAYLGLVTADLGGEFTYDASHIIGDRPPIPNPPNTTWDEKGGIFDRTPITNSVFTPFDPPPEVDYTRTRLSISMNFREPQPWLLNYVNTVNKKKVFFDDGIGGTVASAEPFAAKVMGVSYEERILNGKTFWSTDVEILIDDLFTWRMEILDRGYCDTTNEGVSDAYWKKNIVDKNGLPLAEPVLLNGQGSQLDLEQASAVYLVYGVYPEVDFNIVPFNIGTPQDLQNRIN